MSAADAVPFMKATIRGLKRPPLPAGRYDAGDLGSGGGMMAAKVGRDAGHRRGGTRRQWRRPMQAVMLTRGRKRAFGFAGKIQLVGRIWVLDERVTTRRRSPDTVASLPVPRQATTIFRAPQAMTPAMTGKMAMTDVLSWRKADPRCRHQ